MPDVFNTMLHEWHNFYFMAGGAAAGLVGLMFVALSLGVGLVTDSTRENIKIFATPSIFYFVSALMLACVMLIPRHTPPVMGLLLFIGGTIGLQWTLAHVRLLVGMAKKYQDFTVVDWLSQVILPVASYVLIVIAAVCLVAEQWPLAMSGLWLAVIFLMLSAIANTWSLVMWIIDQRRE